MGIIAWIAESRDKSPYSICFDKESDATAYMKFLKIAGQVEVSDRSYKIVQNKKSPECF